MSWEVRAQFSQVNAESPSEECEWSAVVVDTQEQAESWWNCRVQSPSHGPRVHTMFNSEGEVVRVAFN